MLRVPTHTRIGPHDHQDERVATVISGTWYIGSDDAFAPAALKALPPGSFYTEPAHRTHFAETRDEPVIVQITGMGPSSGYLGRTWRVAWRSLHGKEVLAFDRLRDRSRNHLLPRRVFLLDAGQHVWRVDRQQGLVIVADRHDSPDVQ